MVTTDYAQGEQTEQVTGGRTKRNADTKSSHTRTPRETKSTLPVTIAHCEALEYCRSPLPYKSKTNPAH